MTYTYRKGITTGRPMTFLWHDYLGAAIDFSTGYTFTAYLTDTATPSVLAGTKSAGITGYTTAQAATLLYNVLIDWVPGDFTNLTGDRMYSVELVATPSGGDPFAFPGTAVFKLEVAPA